MKTIIHLVLILVLINIGYAQKIEGDKVKIDFPKVPNKSIHKNNNSKKIKIEKKTKKEENKEYAVPTIAEIESALDSLNNQFIRENIKLKRDEFYNWISGGSDFFSIIFEFNDLSESSFIYQRYKATYDVYKEYSYNFFLFKPPFASNPNSCQGLCYFVTYPEEECMYLKSLLKQLYLNPTRENASKVQPKLNGYKSIMSRMDKVGFKLNYQYITQGDYLYVKNTLFDENGFKYYDIKTPDTIRYFNFNELTEKEWILFVFCDQFMDLSSNHVSLMIYSYKINERFTLLYGVSFMGIGGKKKLYVYTEAFLVDKRGYYVQLSYGVNRKTKKTYIDPEYITAIKKFRKPSLYMKEFNDSSFFGIRTFYPKVKIVSKGK